MRPCELGLFTYGEGMAFTLRRRARGVVQLPGRDTESETTVEIGDLLLQIAGNLAMKADKADSATEAQAYASAAAALLHARRDQRYPFHSSPV